MKRGHAQFPGRAGRAAPRFMSARVSGGATGFTLIELILVMSILTVAISITAPALANFFRGRTLDSEARRLLALTRWGQNRAVSEGIPIELWIDTRNRKFGLEAEPSYETTDEKAVEFELSPEMRLETVRVEVFKSSTTPTRSRSPRGPFGAVPTTEVLSRHAELPRIRFLPDGTIAETSPQKLSLTGADGFSLYLALSRHGLNYELTTRSN